MMTITPEDIYAMVEYWLMTPVNSRLGSDFGNTASSLIPDPYNNERVAEFLKKLMNDVPVLQVLPRNTINIYAVEKSIDQAQLVLEISGQHFLIN